MRLKSQRLPSRLSTTAAAAAACRASHPVRLTVSHLPRHTPRWWLRSRIAPLLLCRALLPSASQTQRLLWIVSAFSAQWMILARALRSYRPGLVLGIRSICLCLASRAALSWLATRAAGQRPECRSNRRSWPCLGQLPPALLSCLDCTACQRHQACLWYRPAEASCSLEMQAIAASQKLPGHHHRRCAR